MKKLRIRPMAELLEIVKKEFNNPTKWGSIYTNAYYGLCTVFSALHNRDVINNAEYDVLRCYMREYLQQRSNRKFFDGIDWVHIKKCQNLDSLYGWAEESKPGRNRWLNKHIKLNS